MFSEDCILVYLSLDSGQFCRQSQTLPSVSVLALRVLDLPDLSSYPALLWNLASEDCSDHLLTAKMPLSLVFCLNIIIAMVACDPRADKVLALSPWCYGKW